MAWWRSVLGSRGAGDAPPPATAAGAEAPPPAAGADWKALGNAALAAGALAEARRCFEQGVLAQPGDASLRLNLGFVLLELGDAAAAADRLLQALALRRPGEDIAHDAHYLSGRAHLAMGDLSRAVTSFEAAAAARPGFIEPLQDALPLLQQLGRHAAAADCARRLFALRPSPETRRVLATELAASGRDAEAVELMAQICAEAPADIDAAVLYFNVLFRTGAMQEALVQAQRVLQSTGPNAGALVNVAVTLEKLGRPEEALARLEQADKLAPGRRDVLVNRTGVLIQLGRIDAALRVARAGLRQFPEDADLHFNLGVCLLLQGDFAGGFAAHEWRGRSSAFHGQMKDLGAPQWQGESLQGRTLFLHGEQGFGDSLQFVRFVPQLARQARTLLLQVPAPLEPLVQGLAPNCRVLPQGAALPPIDFHCSLLGLPAALGLTLATVPASVPYLHADPAAVRAWRKRLGSDSFNVGIAWSGNPRHVNDHNRSATLEAFRALDAEGCRFVTVQPQLAEADRQLLAAWPNALDAGRDLRDFADTAALVDALDLVISVDTGVAHLAGALGKPLWILLPQVPDWRWLLDRDTSPWYPNARLYRQAAARAWPAVLAKVHADLQAEVARRRIGENPHP